MITKAEKIGFIVIGLVVVLAFIFWKDVMAFSGAAESAKVKGDEVAKVKGDNGKKSKNENKQDENDNITSDVTILQKWDLPSDLKEVSGIAYIDEQRFACIQDEEGKIFIYNTASGEIEKQIPFAAPGDYEGITLKGSTAYVVRADGTLYEVDMSSTKKSAQEYKTSLTVEQDIEGLCYDQNNDRLLLSIKGDEPGKPGYKGIYAFDLAKKSFKKEPVFKIDLQHEVLNTAQDKKDKDLMPSSIGIHPATNDILITDGPKAMLLVMDNSGNIKKLYQLGKNFAQPEGITFSPKGEIFISNEGSKQPGNIVKVEIKK